jgi:transcriptional regulator
MYIPSHFQIEDVKIAYDFIKDYSFATLFSQHNGIPFATHLPLILDKDYMDILLVRIHNGKTLAIKWF